MPANENEEFEFRARAEREHAAPVQAGPKPDPLSQIPDSKPMQGAAAEPPKPDSILHKIAGVGEAGLTLGTGAVAAPYGAFKAGMEMLPGTGPRPPGNFMDRAGRYAQEKTYSPRTQTGQAAVEHAGSAMESMGALGPEFGGYGSLLKGAGAAAPAARQALPAIAGKYGGAAVEGVNNAASKYVGAPLSNAAETLRGVPAVKAREEALAASKGALGQESSQLGRVAVTKGQEASQQASVAEAFNRNLEQLAARGERPTLDVQGKVARQAVTGAYDAAKAERTAQTAPMYEAAEKAAAAREAQGARIDVSAVTPDVKALMQDAKNIPDLQAKLGKLLGAVEGTAERPGVAAPVGSGKVSSRMTPPKATTPREGLTYKELDLANKYLKDIAYSGEMQGYDSIVRRAALGLSKKLDSAITKFVPEHAAAAEKYAELSAPLESQATRIGKAVTGGEGGLKGDAYNKIADQALPARLFGTKDGIELVVDAIAGGKAGKAERAAAQAQVDKLVEHYVLEGARGAEGRTGAAAAGALRAPQMSATLQAVPGVERKLVGQFESEARMGRAGERAAEAGKVAGAEAKAAAGAKAKIDKAMAQAEVDYTHGSKKDAYDQYVAALRQSMAGDPQRYRAAIGLIDRAGTLQAKTDKARALAKKFLWGAAAVGAGYEAKGLVQ